MRMVKLAVIVGAFLLLGIGARADDWSAWKHRMPINLGRVDRETIGILPIDATISLKASEMGNASDPARELRLIHRKGEAVQEVPFQLSRGSVWDGDTSPSVATFNGRITFFPVDQTGTYELLYGNPSAPIVIYETDLKVNGEGPHWTIENSVMSVQLREGDKVKPRRPDDRFGDSGQMGNVTLKSRPQNPIMNGNRILHWNPGVYIPKRGWMHPYSWDPPAECEIEKGPVFVEVRRRGPLPEAPEIEAAVTYRFFTGRSYAQIVTRLEFLKDLGVAAVRNNECIFREDIFTDMAWQEAGSGKLRHELISKYKPAGPRRGDILRLEPDTPWFAFYQPETKIGAAMVAVSEDNTGPWGGEPPLFNHALFITHDLADKQVFWVRAQVYFAKDWDRKQLIEIPKGSIYAEKNYYYFYDVERDGKTDGVRQLARAVKNKVDIKVGPYAFPPEK